MLEVYRRGEGRSSFYESDGAEDAVTRASLAFTGPIVQIYEGISLPELIEPEETESDE